MRKEPASLSSLLDKRAAAVGVKPRGSAVGRSAVALYLALRLLAKRKRQVRTSLLRLEIITKISRRWIYRLLKELIAAGWIETRKRFRRKMRFHRFRVQPLSRLCAEFPVEHAEHKWQRLEVYICNNRAIHPDPPREKLARFRVNRFLGLLRGAGFLAPESRISFIDPPALVFREGAGKYRLALNSAKVQTRNAKRDIVERVVLRYWLERKADDGRWYRIKALSRDNLSARLRTDILNDDMHGAPLNAVRSPWREGTPPAKNGYKGLPMSVPVAPAPEPITEEEL